MVQEPVRELMGDIAVLADERMSIVVNDRPVPALEHGHSREDLGLDCTEVARGDFAAMETRERNDRNRQVLSESARIERISRSQAKLAANLASYRPCLALEASPHGHRS